MRNKLVDEYLKDFDVRGKEKCLHRWLILPHGITSEKFEHIALERRVYVYGSERFAIGKEVPVGAVRLAICAPKTLDELVMGLEILRDLLKK
ncbi:MAG: GntR-family transcriptional regulator [Sporomusa sp.]|nr:GntR-family transcriptional regulator [Sporomusa sp.]